MIQSRSTLLALMLALVCSLTVGAAVAVAADAPPSLAITRVDATDFPAMRVEFTRSDTSTKLPQMDVIENGKRISTVRTYSGPLGLFASDPHNVILLAIDTSLSMKADKLVNAQEAARQLLRQARPDDRVGLISFGKTSQILVEPTTNLTLIRTALDGLTLSNGTAMYDGLKLGIDDGFPRNATRKIIVVLSDGTDYGSKTPLEDVVTAARKHDVEIQSVAIQPAGVRPEALQRVAEGTGGSLYTVADSNQLSALFDTLGRRLLGSYWLDYNSSAPGGTQVALKIKAPGFSTASRSYGSPAVHAPDGTTLHITAPPAASAPKPVISLPTGPGGMLVAAAPIALLLFAFSWFTLQRRSRPDITRRIAPFLLDAGPAAKADDEGEQSLLRALAEPFVHVADSTLARSSLFRRIRVLAEQANLPIKPAEMFTAMLASAAGCSVLSIAFSRNLIIALIALAIGSQLPYFWLWRKATKRRKAFEDQLPDVLNGISSSLKAGHSFNQAVAALAKDAPAPTNEEFQRVMMEARLGMPVDQSLQAMSDRMCSDDFEFAVITVNIQRTVGGSLAEILMMVADTIRNRQQFRKKVKALTSMGTASAYVLLAMPFAIAGIISVMSPGYIAPLFTTPTGHIMLMVAGVSMTLGYFACMKIVKVKV